MAIVRQYTTNTVSTEQTILTADANNALDVFAITVGNRGAADADFILRDATAGSTVARYPIKAGSTFGFMRTTKEAMRQAAKGNNWTIQCSAAQAWDVTIEAVQRQGGS